MSFFTPSAAWLFFLVLPLVALYFLKLKRPRVTVPSLVLWRRVLDDQRVNTPFQRFKRNLLLLLQLLLLLLLILAAMQPFFRGKDGRAVRLPVLIDCSASMAARDERGGEPRLELAKRRVKDLIEGLLPDQEMAIISFSDTARQRIGFTSNKQLLKNALEEIEVEEVPSQMEHAFRMAKALGRGAVFDELVLLSDGNVPARAELDLPFRVNFQKLESPAPNIGITACTARRGREDSWEIFVEVGASAGADYGGALTMSRLDAGEEDSLASEIVVTKPGKASRLLFTVAGHGEQNLKFELIPNANFDGLKSDNVAYLSLPALRPLQVYAPEPLQSFRHALRSMDQVEVYPGEGKLPPESFDLVIADDAEPATRPARVGLFMAMVPRDLQGLIEIEYPSSNQAVDWRRDSPLLQHVDFSNVVFLEQPVSDDVQEGTFVNLGYEVLLFGARGPVLLQKRDGDRVTIHALFHPDRSTFPYRVGFPIFVTNLVQLARQEAGLAEARALSTGVLPGLTIEPNQSVRVRGPSGGVTELTSDAEGRLPAISAKKVGIYRYDVVGVVRGANLLSLEETTLAQVEEVEFREATAEAEEQAAEVDRPIWHWLAVIGLLVLLIEWWVFQRRPGGWRRSTSIGYVVPDGGDGGGGEP